MRDNTISKVAVISFLLIGMIMGIILGPFFNKIGSDLLWGIVVMLGMILTFSIIKVFVSRQRNILKKPVAPKADTEVGFVVDTFHDVVGKLKEKELELEKLKSSAEEKAGRAEAYNENILQSVPSGVISVDNGLYIKTYAKCKTYTKTYTNLYTAQTSTWAGCVNALTNRLIYII